MKMTKRILALVLALVMCVSVFAGCSGETETKSTEPKTTTPAGTEPAGTEATTEGTEPVVEDDYDAISTEIYNKVLGEFYTYYQAAKEETNVAKRQALMAIAEAKMLSAGIFLPTTSQGGNYAMTRVAPYTNTPVLWGNDTYRYHDRIVVTEPIEAAHIAEMKAKWGELLGTGEYEAWVKEYLTEKGYETKDHHNFYFDADPESWDVLATSNAADSEILVNTYDGLYEYDMENTLQPALAESYTVSEDGTVYTFKLREGMKWVDNQGREVADVTADDFVAGMQHMMDAMGGLEYLVEGVIVNAHEYIQGDVTDFAEVGVKAVDELTVEYTLCQPTSYFMTMLGYGVFAPMSRSYYESKGGKFGDEFVSDAEDYTYGKGPDSIAYCGPFVITNFTSNNTIAFETNETYWNAEGNNLKSMTFLYTDGSDPQKPYNDFFDGVVDSMGMTVERVTMAKDAGTFDTYAYVSETDATTYCGFFNVNRAAFANFNNAEVGVSPKTEEEIARTGAAMLNQHFRLALAMSIDRGAYNAQSVGEDLKYNSLVNSYTPGTFVFLGEDVTVEINGTETTFPAGTQYGEIVQAQLDADGVALKVWNGTSSAGFDGWFNPEACAAELAIAAEELAAEGVEISAENPIYLDIPVRTDSTTSMNQKQAMKQSIEATTNGMIMVNLVEYATRDNYLDATYWYTAGNEANFDLNDGSGWGPDYGDPQTYLDTMLPDYAGYMTKSLGIF
ncbi:MAG: peptide ABC transporter substrate-binding protein [Ruminococcaceae bacterium]|nr:peptide ABC transporter substrate-binding protein [Oscillospiraceae bacterium]